MLGLVSLPFIACNRTIRVTRVGVDCPLIGNDGEATFLPFGRWLQASVPRFGSYSSVTIQDEARVLGMVTKGCVAESLPKERVLYAKEEGIYIHDNSVNGNWLENQRIIPMGKSCQVIGDGEFLVVLDKGMPQGVVPAQELIADPVQYYTKYFEDHAGTTASANLAFMAISQLDPELLGAPSLAKAMQNLVDTRVREGDFAIAWNDIQTLSTARPRFPALEAVWCDLYPRQTTRDQAKHCKDSSWALVAETGDSDLDLQSKRDEVSALLAGPLFALWRAQKYDGPVIRSSADTAGLPAGKFAVVLGACPEIKAKALLDLTRLFVKNLKLAKLDVPAGTIPCPDGPAPSQTNYLPDGTKIVIYQTSLKQDVSESVVAVAFDQFGKPSSGWYPKTAMSLGPIGTTDEDSTDCSYELPQSAKLSIEATCRRSSTWMQQTGTYSLRLGKNHLTATLATHGRPSRMYEGD
jgi:hypothetical protein